MSAPYLDDGDVQLYHGDALGVLRSLPAGIAQTCVTSPPYWGLRDYGTGSWTGGAADCDHVERKASPHGGLPDAGANSPAAMRATLDRLAENEAIRYRDVCARCGARRVDDQLGLEATPDAYVERLVSVMREVWRVLRADGTLWLNLGDSYGSGPGRNDNGHTNHPSHIPSSRKWEDADPSKAVKLDSGVKAKDLVGVPWRVAFALQADGWYLRSDIIWAKPNPMPESVTDRPTKAHEYVFLLAKQPRYYYDADAIRETAIHEGRVVRATGGDSKNGRAPDEVNDRRTATGFTTHDTLVAGRNARSVWELATQPTPEAHFATYPEALVRRCIQAGTSEAGGCSACGAPWQRQTNVEYDNPGNRSNNGRRDGDFHDRTVKVMSSGQRLEKRVETTGWAASCACDAPPTPQTVLDPFVGSGTTALVARKHGRRALGIDLSESYLEIAAKRTAQLSLLGGAA